MIKHKAKAERHAARQARAAAKATTAPETAEADPLGATEGRPASPDDGAPADNAAPANAAPESENANGGLEGILPGMMSARGESPDSSSAAGGGNNNNSQQMDPPSSGPDSSRPNAATVASTLRTELLRGKAEVLSRFMRLMTPVLVEVYAASVAVVIRTRALAGLLKVASFLEGEELWKVVEV